VFLQEMVGWHDRFFVTGGLRVDGNSAFGKTFGLQPYPKLSLAYVISEEDFWPKQILPTLKLRAALGESGKAPGAFDAVRTWDPTAADEGKPAFTPAQLGDSALGPERTREIETGFDLSALSDRLGFEATAYQATTSRALIGVRYPPSNGFPNLQLENVGTLRNRGVELALTGTPLRTDLFDWSGRVSFTATKSKALDLGDPLREISQGSSQYVLRGQPVPVFRGSVITNPNAIAEPNVAPNTIIGPVYPTRLVGLSTTLRFRDMLTFDILGEYQGGMYLNNWVGYQNALRLVWYPCYDVQRKLTAAAQPGADANAILAGVTALQRGRCAVDRTKANSDYWIEKTNFFKIRSASLSYRLPERFLRGAKSAQLILAGRNLWKSTKYDGLDPELRDASDAGNTLSRREYYQLPPSKQYILSLRATF
jgi:outer membrane receptor protein involved in Fe transport